MVWKEFYSIATTELRNTKKITQVHASFIRKLVMLLVIFSKIKFFKTFLNSQALFCYFDSEEENNIQDCKYQYVLLH